MKPIKFTSILLCFLMVVSVFEGCNAPKESENEALATRGRIIELLALFGVENIIE